MADAEIQNITCSAFATPVRGRVTSFCPRRGEWLRNDHWVVPSLCRSGAGLCQYYLPNRKRSRPAKARKKSAPRIFFPSALLRRV